MDVQVYTGLQLLTALKMMQQQLNLSFILVSCLMLSLQVRWTKGLSEWTTFILSYKH